MLAHLKLGIADRQQHSYEQAIDAFKKCLELNPEVSVRATAYYKGPVQPESITVEVVRMAASHTEGRH